MSTSIRGTPTASTRTMEQILNDIGAADLTIKQAQAKRQGFEQELVAMHTRLTDTLREKGLVS